MCISNIMRKKLIENAFPCLLHNRWPKECKELLLEPLSGQQILEAVEEKDKHDELWL